MRALLLLLAFVPACTSPNQKAAEPKDPRARAEPISDEEWQAARPPRPQGEPVEARYLDYRTTRHLVLVNESHTDPGELYSQKRSMEQSLTKVGSDEILDALRERWTNQGFFKLAQRGPAPLSGGGRYTTALEFTRAGESWHLLSSGSGDAKARSVYVSCVSDFVQLYTSILQLQSVDNAPAWESKASKPKPKQP